VAAVAELTPRQLVEAETGTGTSLRHLVSA